MTIQAQSGAEDGAEKSPYQFGVWRSFETAPTNGDDVLVFRPDAGVFTAFYLTCGDAWFTSADEDIDAWFTSAGEDISDDLPTHWMPLPPPPCSGDREVEPKPTGEE